MLVRDGAALRIAEVGSGRPMLFQHGLGGDAAQIAEHLPDRSGWAFLTLECRGQGSSLPGVTRPFSLAMFAADLAALCDARGLGRFVLGGISMGAAIALRLAVQDPGRVAGLVLARPAWLFAAAPANMRPFAEVAALLREHAPPDARDRFVASATARMLADQAPDNLASLLRFFERPDPALTADLLADIAADGPGVTQVEAAALAVPTLVIGHAVDYVHPLATARALAAIVPDAEFVQITPKAANRARHTAEFRAALGDFLDRHPPELT